MYLIVDGENAKRKAERMEEELKLQGIHFTVEDETMFMPTPEFLFQFGKKNDPEIARIVNDIYDRVTKEVQ